MYNYSVIIPYRDTYDLLLTAVASIPDRVDIQIIIIDNSERPLSLDRVPQKKQASILFLTSNPTKGAGHARNVGLQHVQGRWIVFLDADDYFTLEAFASFDKYLNSNYDIVYFDADSIKLCDGTQSSRHQAIHHYITDYFNHHNENCLRYRFVNPCCKMIRADLINKHNIQFDETPVANDEMFSVKIGHNAQKITACNDVVYIITEGNNGSSLTKTKNAKNQFIRFQVAVKRYQFVTSVGQKRQQPRLISFVAHAFLDFGVKEGIKWIKYVHKKGII